MIIEDNTSGEVAQIANKENNENKKQSNLHQF